MRSLRLVFALFFLLAGCEQTRTPSEYRIPASYRGWVITIYNAENYPPLPEVSSYLIHEFSEHGLLLTSSLPEFGWADDRFLFVAEDGEAVPVALHPSAHIQFDGTGQVFGPEGDFYFRQFFVGSKTDLRAAGSVDEKLEEAKDLLRQNRLVPSDGPPVPR